MGDDSREVYPPAARAERLNQRNCRILPTDALGVGSLKQKFRDNVAAIETLQRLEGQGREATDEEKQVLVRYVGWGGLPQAFAWQQDSDWDAERETLKKLLTKEEYKAARASTLNAHYTAAPVIHGIYEAVQRFGFTGDRILEPSPETGHFFGLMPEEMAAHSKLTGIELDPLSARIAEKLYPG